MAWTTPLLHGLTLAEPWLNLLALLAALKAGMKKRFPAITFYLALRFFSGVALLGILNAHHFSSIGERAQTLAYIYGYWLSYIVGAVAIFFAVQEIFKELMTPVPGLQRLGIIAFRWVSVVSVLISIGAALSIREDGDVFATIGTQMMKCVSIMELCLLAFLALTVHSLGRSFRSVTFGLGLGFGLEAASQLVASALIARHAGLYSVGNLILEAITLSAFMTWTAYFFLPEESTVRSAATLPVSSPLIRWNEIAKALGHSAPHVALGQSQAFFLQDVEKVVDKILTKNSIS
ncbi:hypothetical protein HNQ77_005385 [Silvibacterium bohemicum]|uniref:Uncharacterized protein n=1 Tax=Silvibacterium bohemicum TaxID=1577686 RepID=A0A841K609_9BACT|nr:hypothetical protein [Silvibacterium bohemicum]MBB6147389.1 hypothetical protein [Silvibacterium bohemicum]